MKTIGIMHSGSDKKHDDHIEAFKAGLAWAGLYDIGANPNVKIVPPRYADDKRKDLNTIASDLVNKDKVDLLVAAGGTASAQAAKSATQTQLIPTSVVFTSVATSTRPAANMTGICARTSELDPARLDLLNQLLPGETKFGVLINKLRFDYTTQKTNLDTEAARLGPKSLDYQEINPDSGNVEKQIDDAFYYWATQTPRYNGVLITADPLFNNHRAKVIGAAKSNKLAAIYQWREFAVDGGLISYGPNLVVAYKLAGIYVGKILDTTAPTAPKDLDILPLSNIELVINLNTAKDLKRTIPPTLLAQADHIIFA